MTVNLYQSDPRSLTDADLAQLSDELVEAYQRWDGCNDCDYWTDDDAENRYYELRAEISRRRQPVAPSGVPLSLYGYVTAAMRALGDSIDIATINRAFDHEFTKAGHVIHVPRPTRFIGKQ